MPARALWFQVLRCCSKATIQLRELLLLAHFDLWCKGVRSFDTALASLQTTSHRTHKRHSFLDRYCHTTIWTNYEWSYFAFFAFSGSGVKYSRDLKTKFSSARKHSVYHQGTSIISRCRARSRWVTLTHCDQILKPRYPNRRWFYYNIVDRGKGAVL